MRKLIAAAALGLGLVAAQDAQAQALTPFAVEARGGVAVPTGDFGDGVETGYGFGAMGSYNVIPMLAVYGGYEWYTFGTDDADLDGGSLEIRDSGFSLGGKLALPIGALVGVSPWVRAGAIFHQTTMDFDVLGVEGDLESDRSVGFEAGAGLAFPLGLVVSVTPSVTYRQYSPEFDLSGLGGGTTVDAGDVSYLAFEVGLLIGL